MGRRFLFLKGSVLQVSIYGSDFHVGFLDPGVELDARVSDCGGALASAGGQASHGCPGFKGHQFRLQHLVDVV